MPENTASFPHTYTLLLIQAEQVLLCNFFTNIYFFPFIQILQSFSTLWLILSQFIFFHSTVASVSKFVRCIHSNTTYFKHFLMSSIMIVQYCRVVSCEPAYMYDYSLIWFCENAIHFTNLWKPHISFVKCFTSEGDRNTRSL